MWAARSVSWGRRRARGGVHRADEAGGVAVRESPVQVGDRVVGAGGQVDEVLPPLP